MENAIETGHFRPIARGFKIFLNIAQSLDLGLGGMAGGKAGGGGLQNLSHGIKFDHFSLIETADNQAPALPRHDQPLGHQTAKGLAHRGAADIEPIGDFLLAQTVARPVDAAAQGLAQSPVDGLAQRQALAQIAQNLLPRHNASLWAFRPLHWFVSKDIR